MTDPALEHYIDLYEDAYNKIDIETWMNIYWDDNTHLCQVNSSDLLCEQCLSRYMHALDRAKHAVHTGQLDCNDLDAIWHYADLLSSEMGRKEELKHDPYGMIRLFRVLTLLKPFDALSLPELRKQLAESHKSGNSYARLFMNWADGGVKEIELMQLIDDLNEESSDLWSRCSRDWCGMNELLLNGSYNPHSVQAIACYICAAYDLTYGQRVRYAIPYLLRSAKLGYRRAVWVIKRCLSPEGVSPHQNVAQLDRRVQQMLKDKLYGINWYFPPEGVLIYELIQRQHRLEAEVEQLRGIQQHADLTSSLHGVIQSYVPKAN